MKTRNDFVSNSSSSSYIIAVNGSYELSKLAADIAKACSETSDPYDSKQFVDKQTKANKIVMDFHWHMTECVFLGALDVGPHAFSIKRDDVYFKHLKKTIETGDLAPYETLVKNGDDEIVIEAPTTSYCPTTSTYRLDSIACIYATDDKEYAERVMKDSNAVKNIIDFAKDHAQHECLDNVTYFISKRTIANTRALIAAGCKLELEEWMDLDNLDKILDNGDKLLAFEVNHDGDGAATDAIYTFNDEWFDDVTGIEFLN